MKSLFSFRETLEVITDGVVELAENAIKAQRILQRDSKKNDYKA